MATNTKLVLTQIMKNESHVAERMLNSIKPIVDAIVVVDTGSEDDSINIVKNWSKKNNIECHIFERVFDNFENSRNFSIEKAREIFLKDNTKDTYYGFWIDFDEELEVLPNFNKNKLDKDFYMVNTVIGSMKYTRNEVYRLDKKFRFYGPVHEYIIPEEEGISSGILEGIQVNVHTDGASWKEDTSNKYKKHANMLEDYLIKDRNPRWVFYTGQSWHDSASTKSKTENDERLRRASLYYKERVSMGDGYPEERYYAQYRVALISKILENPWSETKKELLKAYSIDPLRGESIKVIIEYYQKIGEWNLSYIYSLLGYTKFHNNSPYPKRLLFVEETIYKWKFLELHMNTLFYIKDIKGSKKLANELSNILKKESHLFKDTDKQRIGNNINRILSLV